MVSSAQQGSNSDDTSVQSFENAHKARVCVCFHKGECMRVYMSACVCTDVKKNLVIKLRLFVLTVFFTIYWEN